MKIFNKSTHKAEKVNVKIVSKDEALWTKVRDSRRSTIQTYEEALIVEKAFLELAESKIKAFKK